jgi:uncharacterized protein
MKFVVTVAALLMMSGAARAASFDCAQAATVDERTVCSNPQLSQLDTVAGAAFNAAKQVTGAADTVPVTRDFLMDRRACGTSVACIMGSYVAVIGVYRDLGSKIAMPDWADAAAIAAGSAPRSGVLPKLVGQCVTTSVAQVTPRLDPGHRPTSSDFGSGTAIVLVNGGYQVSYEREEALLRSQPGDTVLMCLTSIPHRCPVGDVRGRTYAATNLRTRTSWWLPDAEHSCGGA